MTEKTLAQQAQVLYKKYPKNLKQELKKRNMSQHTLSVKSGVHSSQISRFCSGLRPSVYAAAAIVEALDG